jgi:uncharacterized protein YoxC
MSEAIHADIFFFITSTAVIVVTVGVVILLYYLIPIVRDIRAIVAKVRRASDDVERDFQTMRLAIKEEGAKSKALVDLVLGYIARKLKRFVPHREPRQPPSSSEV